MVGALSDIYNSGVSVDFVNSVSEKLTPGKTAVIAEVAEDWVTPLDTRMEAIGGIVMREWRSDFEDEQIEREVNARKAELAKLKEEFANAAEGRKAKLKAQMDAAQTKLSAVAKRAQGRIDQLQQQAQAEIKGMQDQATKANRDTKAKIDRQIAEAQAEYKRRSDKLKQAWELTKQALAA
jgi:paraquat-inducible protein B